jgi:hypothetical protein
MLLEIHPLPMEKQKETMTRRMNDWMGENEQVDDILVIGIRI